MDPATLAIVNWLVSNVGLPILNTGIDQLLIHMGIKNAPEASKERVLIEKYIRELGKDIQQVKATLDEDRLAKLLAALVQVNESQKTVAQREYLTNALNNFHVVVNYPEHEATGNYTNAQLRCIAFVGMAAAHTALHDSQSLVAEKVIEAIYADVDMAKEWLGEKLVNQIISLLPVSPGLTCPKCGFQNPIGSQFCNRDGFPLKPGQKSSLHTASLRLIRRGSFWDFMYSCQILLDNVQIDTINNQWRTELEPGQHILMLRLRLIRRYTPLLRFRLGEISSSDKRRYIDSSSRFVDFDSAPFNFAAASGEEISIYYQLQLSGGPDGRAGVKIWR